MVGITNCTQRTRTARKSQSIPTIHSLKKANSIKTPTFLKVQAINHSFYILIPETDQNLLTLSIESLPMILKLIFLNRHLTKNLQATNNSLSKVKWRVQSKLILVKKHKPIKQHRAKDNIHFHLTSIQYNRMRDRGRHLQEIIKTSCMLRKAGKSRKQQMSCLILDMIQHPQLKLQQRAEKPT